MSVNMTYLFREGQKKEEALGLLSQKLKLQEQLGICTAGLAFALAPWLSPLGLVAGK
jgi:hypothetical protein